MGLALVLVYILSCIYSLLPVTASSLSVPVWTSPSETFFVGQSGASLKCSFQGNPIAVYWLKGESLQTASPIITWYRGEITTRNEGFEFGPDFSLLFEHPGISDTGRYHCRVSNHQGILSSNHVDLTMLVRELDEVQVTQCGGDPFDQDSPCIIKVHPDQDILELDCIVEGAHQPVLLTWHNAGALHISLNTTSSSEKILEDGTYLKKISLRLQSEEMGSERKQFICLAQGPNATKTVNVTIQFEPEMPEEGPSTVGIVVGVIFILALISAHVAYIVWKWFIRRPREKTEENQEAEENQEGEESQERQKLLEQNTKQMNEKREKVLAYRPQNKTTPTSGEIEEPPPVQLGVFGLSRAGKSAFINSLYSALKGEYSPIADESNEEKQRTERREAKFLTNYINRMDKQGLKNYNNHVIPELMNQIREYSPIADESNEEKQRTEWREAKFLTPYINILDNKGLKNYNNHVIPELMNQIRGNRGQVPHRVVQSGDTVDCPILICNFSDGKRDDNAATFISDFSNEVHKLLGRRLVVVLTHKDELATDDGELDKMKNWLVKKCEIPASHVWIFENYTEANHEENVVKTNEFLEFLLKCVELAERNVNFRHTNETQTPPQPLPQTREWKCIIS